MAAGHWKTPSSIPLISTASARYQVFLTCRTHVVVSGHWPLLGKAGRYSGCIWRHRKRTRVAVQGEISRGQPKPADLTLNRYARSRPWGGDVIRQIGLEVGLLSQWLHARLIGAGRDVVLLETRHVKAALSAMTVKTDRKDARGIALAAADGMVPPGSCQIDDLQG